MFAWGWDTSSGKHGELLSRIERFSLALSNSEALSSDVLLQLLCARPGLLDLDLQTCNIVEMINHLVAFPLVAEAHNKFSRVAPFGHCLSADFLALLKSVAI